MRRRSFLAAAALGVAGCATGGETTQTTVDGGTATPTDRPTRGGGGGTVTTPPGDPADASVVSQSLVTRDRDTGTEYALTGEVTNTGEIFLASLSVTATFTRGDETLDAYTYGMIDVGVGETWEVWMPHFGDEVPDGGTLTVAGWGFSYGRSPEGLTVVDDALELPDTETAQPRVTGQVRNGSGEDLGIVEAHVKFYAEDGNILAGDIRSTSPLAAGEAWPFTVTANSYNFRDWNDRFADHTAEALTVP